MSKSPRIRESKPKDLSRAFRKKGRKGVRKAGEKTHLTSNVTDSLIASFAKLRKHDKSTVTYRLTELYLSGLTLNQPACPGKRHSEDKPGSPPPPPHFLSPSQHPNRKRLHTTLLPFSGQISDSLNHLRSLTCSQGLFSRSLSSACTLMLFQRCVLRVMRSGSVRGGARQGSATLVAAAGGRQRAEQVSSTGERRLSTAL